MYGYNTGEERADLWRDIRRCSGSVRNMAWSLMGDFNVVRCQEERSGGNPVDRAEMTDFNVYSRCSGSRHDY